MQQSIGNNRISLIVNNHIQQFEIKATLPFSNRTNLKPPLYRGNAHNGPTNKKNHSLSIHHHHHHINNNGNHLKVIPVINNKRLKVFSNNPNNNNNNTINNGNNSINNISINNSNSNIVNTNLQSNQINSFHRPQSPVVLNISSDRHYLYQQQQQYSFQHQVHNQNHNNSNNNNNHQIGANFGSIPFMRDRPSNNYRHNSIKLIKGKTDHSISSKQIGSISILQSNNSCYQKNNISSMIDSPITKSSHNHHNQNIINGISSSNDQNSDVEKVNNSSSNGGNTNNGTISNINISNIQFMNNSSNINTNANQNSSSNNNNNNTSQNNNSNSSSSQNNAQAQNNYNYSNESNRNNTNKMAMNINNPKSNLSSYNRQEKKYRISKTQILFPFNSKENICYADNQNIVRSSSKNQLNTNSNNSNNSNNNSHHSKIITNNPKILNNQNFEEDEILFNKASSQPAEVLREQMALGTPPQLAAYTTSATTDTIHRQTFRIKHYNLSSRQSSRGGLKSTQTSDPISSAQTNNNIGEMITQSNNNNKNKQYNDFNLKTNTTLSNNEINDLSPNIISNTPHQYHYNRSNITKNIQNNFNNFPNNLNFNSNNIINNNPISSNNNIQQPRLLSSRSASKISQNVIRKLARQPSTHIVQNDPTKIHLYPHQNSNQANIIVRKNSYWYNQREQLERKKKKEKSILSSNHDITENHHQQITEPFSIDDHDEEISSNSQVKKQHLFKFPSKDDKLPIHQQLVEKNNDSSNNARRENSPRINNVNSSFNTNINNTNNPKGSKRQSIAKINQKQQQMLTHQPLHQVPPQGQQIQQQQQQQQQQQSSQQSQQIQNKYPQFNFQFQLSSNNGQTTTTTISQHPSIFSLNPTSTLLNIKTLSIKKAISSDSTNRHDDMMITGTNPFHDVELRELLGEGAYGKVYKGFIKKTGKFIAVKQLKLGLKDNKLQEKLEQYIKEITLLNHLEHPNIVKYYDCKHEEDNIYIYMEQMPGGSLSSMLQKFGRFDEGLIKKFVKQIIQGLAYLHSQGVVHRDIKGANILSDGNGTVKLADFGAARHRDTLLLPTADGSEFCDSIKGSLYWMAPELLNQESHGRKSDIWSLGCTIIEMATGKHPWPDCRAFPQLALLVKTNSCPPIPDDLSEVCKDFVRKCCTFDKKQRPTADFLLNHPFLQDD